MDRRAAEESSNVVLNPPGEDTSTSDDDIPLSKLLTKPCSEETQSHGNRCRLTTGASTNSKKDKRASDYSSADEPLIKRRTNSASIKKPVKDDNLSSRSNGTDNRKADDSSDSEPLAKTAKLSSKATKKPLSVPPKKSVDAKKKGSLDEDNISDDEPFSELAEKIHSQRNAPVVPSRKASPVTKIRRTAARKNIKYAESSSDSSDNEPLATMKRKLTEAPEVQRTSAISKKTKPKVKDKSLKDPTSSDDDDVPLVNLMAKKKQPVKKNTVTQGSASRKRPGLSDESSDDEPLINLVKKDRTNKQTQTKTKASAATKNKVTPKEPRTMLVSGTSNNSSDDEPVTKVAKHPQVTKNLTVILERCDAGVTGVTGRLNKTCAEAGTAIVGNTLSEESEGSAESREEE